MAHPTSIVFTSLFMLTGLKIKLSLEINIVQGQAVKDCNCRYYYVLLAGNQLAETGLQLTDFDSAVGPSTYANYVYAELRAACPSGIEKCECSNAPGKFTTGPFNPEENFLALLTYIGCSPGTEMSYKVGPGLCSSRLVDPSACGREFTQPRADLIAQLCKICQNVSPKQVSSIIVTLNQDTASARIILSRRWMSGLTFTRTPWICVQEMRLTGNVN